MFKDYLVTLNRNLSDGCPDGTGHICIPFMPISAESERAAAREYLKSIYMDTAYRVILSDIRNMKSADSCEENISLLKESMKLMHQKSKEEFECFYRDNQKKVTVIEIPEPESDI